MQHLHAVKGLSDRHLLLRYAHQLLLCWGVYACSACILSRLCQIGLFCCADLLLLCWGVCLQCLHAAKGLADWLLLLC